MLYVEESEATRFGYRLARIKIGGGQTVSVDEINHACRGGGVEMLILRVPTARLDLVHDLEAGGFQLMDCLVYYEAHVQSIPQNSRKPEIRTATPDDAPAVGQIARRCFVDYFSHYHADPRLDRCRIAEGYIEWGERSCNDPTVATAVLLPEVNGQIAGFASMRRNSAAEGEGVLFAVDPAFAGGGIHTAMVERGKQWCAEQGLTRMIISTQLENRRVQRSYANCGFRLFESYFTFHRWYV